MEQSEAIRRAGIAIYDALNEHDEVAITQYFDSGPNHLSVGTGADEVWQGGRRRHELRRTVPPDARARLHPR